MSEPYQIDGEDNTSTLWEGSPIFRRLIYSLIGLGLIVCYGFFGILCFAAKTKTN